MGDKNVCRVIFNQDLTGNISIRGINGCLESGVDTFYVSMNNHLDVFWNFGDDSEIKMLHQLTHTFKNNGQYTVKLLTESLYGCADSMSQIVSIAAVKGLFIPNAFNGKPLPKGVYRWEANAIFIDGSVWEGMDGYTKGEGMLIR